MSVDSTGFLDRAPAEHHTFTAMDPTYGVLAFVCLIVGIACLVLGIIWGEESDDAKHTRLHAYIFILGTPLFFALTGIFFGNAIW